MHEAGLPGPVTAADIGAVMGLTHEQIRLQLFPQLDPALWEAFSRLAYQREEEWIRREGGVLYPGVADALRSLSRNHPLAIVSNCQRGYIEVFLEWTGLVDCFVDWECHGNTGLSKGENLRSLCARHGWVQALYVGDTSGDEVAAAEAGCEFLFAEYGFGRASSDALRLSTFADLVERVAA